MGLKGYLGLKGEPRPHRRPQSWGPAPLSGGAAETPLSPACHPDCSPLDTLETTQGAGGGSRGLDSKISALRPGRVEQPPRTSPSPSLQVSLECQASRDCQESLGCQGSQATSKEPKETPEPLVCPGHRDSPGCPAPPESSGSPASRAVG